MKSDDETKPAKEYLTKHIATLTGQLAQLRQQAFAHSQQAVQLSGTAEQVQKEVDAATLALKELG